MTRLHDLYTQGAQSPWLDNLRRDWIDNGELAGWIDKGVRGVTSNPAIFQKAFTVTDAYDSQFSELLASGRTVEDAYWDLVVADIRPLEARTATYRSRWHLDWPEMPHPPWQRPVTCTRGSADPTCT